MCDVFLILGVRVEFNADFSIFFSFLPKKAGKKKQRNGKIGPWTRKDSEEEDF